MPIPSNPFGIADQTLSRNTSHPQNSGLLAAFIPRSSSKFVEVVGGNSLTGVSPTGTYDSDGCWFGNNGSTRQWCQIPITAINTNASTTVIVGLKHNGSGGSDGTAMLAGISAGVAHANNGYLEVAGLSGSRVAGAYMADSFGNLYGIDYNGTAYTATPAQDTFAVAVKSSVGAQAGLVRQLVSGANSSTAFSGSGVSTPSSGANLDRVGIFWASKYGLQYIFVYNSYMADATAESIMDDPGSVLTYSGGGGGGGPLTIAYVTRPVFGF